jgi:hypothetical protein
VRIDAAVAANTSTRRTSVMSVRTKENVIVNTAIVTRRMVILLMKYSAMIPVIGRADETIWY